jgi:hypothetical protein
LDHQAQGQPFLHLNFDENIGEYRLSIQSTYDFNINNPYDIDSIAPNR